MIRLAGPGSSSTHFEIITLSELKAYMPNIGSVQDTLLTGVVAHINRAMYTAMGGRFIKSTGVEFDYLLEPANATQIFLPHRPIVSITSIEYVNILSSTQFQVIKSYAATEYLKDDDGGFLEMVQTFFMWPMARNSIRARWFAGFVTIPEDIKKAALVWGTSEARRAIDGRQDKLSVVHEGDNVQFTSDEAPRIVRDVIQQYLYKEMTVA